MGQTLDKNLALTIKGESAGRWPLPRTFLLLLLLLHLLLHLLLFLLLLYNAHLRALACSSQPAAASTIESSATASASTALYDAQACKRMRQRATQDRNGKRGRDRSGFEDGENEDEKEEKDLSPLYRDVQTINNIMLEKFATNDVRTNHESALRAQKGSIQCRAREGFADCSALQKNYLPLLQRSNMREMRAGAMALAQ